MYPLLVEFGGRKCDQLEGAYKKNNLPINEIVDLRTYAVGAKITSLEATTFLFSVVLDTVST